MKLYDMERSGNCYKVRLMLSLLGQTYETATVDLTKGENFDPSFLDLNPRAQIPVLEDGPVRIWDSMAILVYLARRYGEIWLPADPAGEAEVMQWLALSENEGLYGLARSRAIRRFGRSGDLADSQEMGRAGLRVLNQQLTDHDWLALDRPTIADVACYPYVGLAPEGDISLDGYPALHPWMARIRDLPGYVGMQGL